MRKFILYLITLVIVDPYKGLKYDQVNAYYYFREEQEVVEYSPEDLEESKPIFKLSKLKEFDDNEEEDDDCEYCLSEDELSSFHW